jgi:hypothetical protein
VEDLVYRRRRSALDFTPAGVVSSSFTRLRVAEWLSRRLYITIGGILVLLSGDFGGILFFSSSSGSLSERTAN